LWLGTTSIHRLLPSEIPFRANVYALKTLGVKYLLSFGTCGSLKEEVKPLDVILVDQFIDRTFGRPTTFFGNGIIAHVPFGDPVCPIFRELVFKCLPKAVTPDIAIHNGGTYVCIEGPAFSTKAESRLYRQWDCAVIGMTAITEAKLAREAEIAYVCVGLVTDYDCWHPEHDQVTTELVVRNLKKNGDTAQKIVIEVVKAVGEQRFESSAHTALQGSILTHKEHLDPALLASLRVLLAKHFLSS